MLDVVLGVGRPELDRIPAETVFVAEDVDEDRDPLVRLALDADAEAGERLDEMAVVTEVVEPIDQQIGLGQRRSGRALSVGAPAGAGGLSVRLRTVPLFA